jgi:transcriptional regulator with XRE-family HTH domain
MVSIPSSVFQKESNSDVKTITKTAGEILADNLQRVIAARQLTNKQFADLVGIGNGTIDRIRKNQVSATVTSIEQIANFLECEAWQLLVPNFNPSNPPVLTSQSETERELYQRIAALAKQLNGI